MPSVISEQVAQDVAEGVPVRWAEVTSSADSDEDRAVVEQLAAIAALRDRMSSTSTRAPLVFGRHPLDTPARALVAVASLRLGLAGLCVGGLAVLSAGWPNDIEPVHTVTVGAFAIAGTILLRHNRADARAAELGIVFLLIATSFANGLYGAAPAVIPGLGTLLSAFPVDGFLAYAVWRFVRWFPNSTPPLPRAPAAALPIAAVAGTFLLVANAVAVLFPRTMPGLLAEPFARRSAQGTIYWTVVFGLMIPALAALVWRVIDAEAESRRRGWLFLAGLVAGLFPLSVHIVLETISAAYRQTAGEHEAAVVAVAIGFLLTIPVTTTYAVLVSRVLEVRVIIRRTLQYALARTSLAVATALPLVFIVGTIYRQRDLPVAMVFAAGNVKAALTLLVASVALSRIRPAVLRTLDRLFFRSTYDPSELLGSVLDEARRSTTLHETCHTVLERVAATLHVSSAGILVRDGAGQLVPVAGPVGPLCGDGALATLAGAMATPMYVDLERSAAAFRRLPDEDLFWLTDNDLRALVPVHGSNGTLIALMTLGAPKSDEPLQATHGAFIAALGAGLAAPLEQRLAGSPFPVVGSAVDAERAAECEACGLVSSFGTLHCERCGRETAPAVIPQTLAGKFTIAGQLGRGGMGVVYRAVDTTLGRQVAVKTLPRVTPEHAVRLRREARTMAALAHPNLAMLYGLETWRGTPMLIVEYLEGGTLADRLQHGRIALPEWMPIAHGILAALAHIHGKGILHRDLKPSNVGFTADGVPKLLDFGLAQLVGEAAARDEIEAPPAERHILLSDRRVGTPAYMSPEAVRGESPAVTFDLWAFGVITVEALSGRSVFIDTENALTALREGRLPRWRDWLGGQPEALIEVLENTLGADPSHRPQTAGALAHQLNTSLDT